jgi:hypothetical protein
MRAGARMTDERRLTRCEWCSNIFDVSGVDREDRHDGPRYRCWNCSEFTYGPVNEYIEG